MILGGEPYTDGAKLEVINMADHTYPCNPVLKFPMEMSHGTGGLINDKVPLICGGQNEDGMLGNCYKLENRAFIETDPISPRAEIGSSNVVIHESLWIGGGKNGNGISQSSQLMSMENRSKSYAPLNPGLTLQCTIQINETTIMVTGGKVDTNRCTKQTNFFNFETNLWTPGPPLIQARESHGCARFDFKGNMVLIIAGGGDCVSFLDSVELLEMNFMNNGWFEAMKLPRQLHGLQMITGPQGRGALVFGGKDGNHEYSKEIYRFQCLYAFLNACEWFKVEHSLKYGRSNHIVMPIPESTSMQLCMRLG